MNDVARTATVGKLCVTSGDAKRSRGARPGPLLQANSSETKRLATAILEVLAGVRTPADAAKTLEISLPRYYQLEQRALTGLLEACEPRTKGRQPSVERETVRLQRELASCQRECARQQALVRAAQRAVGLAAPQPPLKNGVKQSRRRRPTARALRAARAIEVNSSATNEPTGVQSSPSAGGDGSDAQPPPRPPQP
jgi:hypothetical protein